MSAIGVPCQVGPDAPPRLRRRSRTSIIAHVESDFTRRERESQTRGDAAAVRAAEARERAAQAGARAEAIAAGGSRPEGDAARSADAARTSAQREFVHARDAHLRSARMHDEAAESALRRGDDAAAAHHRDAAGEARTQAAAEPVEATEG
jgi:hypothetical protein